MAFKRSDAKNWTIVVNGVRQSSGTTVKKDAEALERRLNLEVWNAEKMGIAPPKSWAEACVRWAKEKSGKESWDWDRVKIKWLDQFFGDVTDINKITRQRVDELMIKERGATGTRSSVNSTTNRFVALIASILNAAEGEWEWGTKAPRLRKYPEPLSNGRDLTIEEWRKLQRELPEHLMLAATFALCTGLREAKVFGLRWEQLGTNRSLSFDGTANKRGNCIPLNGTSQAIISQCRSLPVRSLTHVFSYNGKPMEEHGQASFRKAVERAGIGHVRWKDFRTTFCSWLAQNGVDEPTTRRLMGHVAADKSDAKVAGSVHDRYKHLYVEHLRPACEIIDKVLTDGTEEQRMVSMSLRKVG